MSQPSPLSAARHHAQAQASAGDLAGARATLTHAVEAGGAELGEDDPAVLAAAHQLAEVHRQAGDPSAARRVLEEALAAGQWRLGDADPLILAVSFDLGLVAEELGNRHEARRAFGRVAALGPQVLGDDHWAVSHARRYLGDGSATAPTPVADAPADRPGPPARREPPAPDPGPNRSTGSAVVPHAPSVRADPEPAQRYVPVEPVAVPVQRLGVPEPARVPAGDVAAAYAGRGRGPLLFAAITAGLAAVIAVVALVVVLATRDADPSGPAGVPILGGPAPGDVRLRDTGSTIVVSWQDPTDGTVSFVVMGGRPGEQLRVMGRLGPGQNEHRLDGLNPRLDYCFAVVAVYSAEKVSTSPQSCTSRATKDSAPSPTD